MHMLSVDDFLKDKAWEILWLAKRKKCKLADAVELLLPNAGVETKLRVIKTCSEIVILDITGVQT